MPRLELAGAGTVSVPLWATCVPRLGPSLEALEAGESAKLEAEKQGGFCSHAFLENGVWEYRSSRKSWGIAGGQSWGMTRYEYIHVSIVSHLLRTCETRGRLLTSGLQ